jgi:uncharacterized protein (DUF58 family)
MQTLIQPALLAQLKNLPLVAKTVAQGFLHGIHSSKQRGSGMEFNQYRAYEPGDPLQNIDWKLFARSDRYYVREAQRESNIQVWFLIDASASMLHKSSVANASSWHKLDYAKHLAATMSYLAQLQGDSVGLLSLHSKTPELVRAMAGYQHWQRCVLHLSQIEAGSTFPNIEHLQSQLSRVREHGLVIVLSDFYQQQQEILELMTQLQSPRTDLIAMQLGSNDEQFFPYKGRIHFEDRETGERRTLSGTAAKQSYLQQFEMFNNALARDLKAKGIVHEKLSIDEPMDEALRRFLTARIKKA